jgi:hypothetical protein
METETEQEKEDRLQAAFLAHQQKYAEVDHSKMCSLCVLRFKKWLGATDKNSLAKIWRNGVKKLKLRYFEDEVSYFYKDGSPKCPECNKKVVNCPECHIDYCCLYEWDLT